MSDNSDSDSSDALTEWMKEQVGDAPHVEFKWEGEDG